jgi:hypothetical protein
VIGIVRLIEGPQMMASIVDLEIDALVPGMAVRMVPSVAAGSVLRAGGRGGGMTTGTEQERLEHNLIQRVNLADCLRRSVRCKRGSTRSTATSTRR